MKTEVHLPGKRLARPQVSDVVRTPTGRPGVISRFLAGDVARVKYTDGRDDCVDLPIALLRRPVSEEAQ